MGQSACKPQFTPFGSLFEPLFFRKDGRPVYPVLGGAPDDENGENGTQSGSNAGQSAGDDSGEQGDQGGNGSGNDDAGNGSEGQGSGSSDAVTREEFDAVMRRMQAADRRASAAEAQVKEFKQKDLSELEKKTGQVEELETTLSQRDERIQELQMELAFFKSNKVEWHDPALARKEIDMSLVSVEDDGTVKGMDKALKKLAEDKPFLVKTGDGKKQASGGSFNGDRKKPASDSKILAGKYPALRGRGGNTQ